MSCTGTCQAEKLIGRKVRIAQVVAVLHRHWLLVLAHLQLRIQYKQVRSTIEHHCQAESNEVYKPLTKTVWPATAYMGCQGVANWCVIGSATSNSSLLTLVSLLVTSCTHTCPFSDTPSIYTQDLHCQIQEVTLFLIKASIVIHPMRNHATIFNRQQTKLNLSRLIDKKAGLITKC
jgi:hypothetical protein